MGKYGLKLKFGDLTYYIPIHDVEVSLRSVCQMGLLKHMKKTQGIDEVSVCVFEAWNKMTGNIHSRSINPLIITII